MNQTIKISLIRKTYTVDSIGNPIPTEEKLSRYAITSNINQSEYYNAELQGLRPYACYTVRLMEYDGEDEIEVDGKRLTIYRTYNRTDGRVELYTVERKGTK